MFRRMDILACAVCGLAAASAAQSPPLRYVLHAGPRPHIGFVNSFHMSAVMPHSVLKTSPDVKTVYVLIPQKDRRWQLTRLSHWNTATPAEQSLILDGDAGDDRQDYITGDLTPTADGTQLFVRILVYPLDSLHRRVTVIQIDLKSFLAISRKTSDDPLLANSQWRMTEGNTLIATEGPSTANGISHGHIGEFVRPDVLEMTTTTLGEHTSAVLSLPDLRISLACRYTLTTGPYFRSSKDEMGDCTKLLHAASVSALADLPGTIGADERLAHLAGAACQLLGLSDGYKRALYDCRKERMVTEFEMQTLSRWELVLFTANAQTSLYAAIPVNERFSAALGSAEGHDYLLILRDDVKMEVHTLP